MAERLRKEVQGEVLFDAFSRGRYSTDASIYQIMPIGVVVPRTEEDAVCAMQIAAEAGVPILPRGGGTSQCGQTVGEALIIDHSKYLNGVIEFDAQARTVCVQPGMVLDHLNSHLKAQHLFFPVDPSTADRATLGGMAGNNSCGTRSLRYGNMVHNVRAIDAVLASGESIRFGAVPENLDTFTAPARYLELVRTVRGYMSARHRRSTPAIRSSCVALPVTTSIPFFPMGTTWRSCWLDQKALSPCSAGCILISSQRLRTGSSASVIFRDFVTP